MILGGFDCWFCCVDSVVVGPNVVAPGSFHFQVVLDALAAFIIQDVEFRLVPQALYLVVHLLEGGNHAVVFTGPNW